MSLRKKFRMEIDSMLDDDEITPEEAAFLHGYYFEECN